MRSAIFIALCQIVAVWPAPAQSDDNQSKMNAKVDALIAQTISEGHHKVNGVDTYPHVPIDDKLVSEIKAFGDAVIPELSSYFESSNPQECSIAVRVVAIVGSKSSLEALTKVIEKTTETSCRVAAVAMIGTVDSNLGEVAHMLNVLALEDHDPEVIREAQLASHR